MKQKYDISAKEGRLKLYKKMLKSFTIGRYIGWFIPFWWDFTNDGFCVYLKFTTDHINLYSLVELCLFTNNNKEIEEYTMKTGYWFKPGDRLSRIKLLREVIKEMENNT